MQRVLLVTGENGKKFKVTVPEDAKVTFGPWAPPNTKGVYGENSSRGTLRIYKGSKDNIIACFGGVTGFRDLQLPFAEEVAKEEGSTIWKDDEKGYVRESKVTAQRDWIEHPPLLSDEPRARRRR